MNFTRIKQNYNDHLWDKNMVRIAVKKGVITKREYMLITSELCDPIPNLEQEETLNANRN